MGLASYSLPAPEFSVPQTVFDYRDTTFSAGVWTITIRLPPGFYQVDAYCGTVIRDITASGPRYNARRLAFAIE